MKYINQLISLHNVTSYMCVLLLGCISFNAYSSENITFKNIADDIEQKIDFKHGKSAERFAKIIDFRERSLVSPIDFEELYETPTQTQGIPGVAILDYDRDGDLDVYLTNGPNFPNSLYSNQIEETGKLSFIDVAKQAGVAALDQDSTAVCYGDIDNDGDLDLFVLGRNEANRLFVNNGNLTFSESLDSGLEVGEFTSSTCSMGDIDNDGLLDIVVGNAFNQSRYSACWVENFELNEPNQLYINRGSNKFEDVSESSGILDMAGFPSDVKRGSGITWAAAMVDINLDGYTDILFADDQCATPTAIEGGVNRGYIHALINDGNAHFIDKPLIIDDFSSGGWMGLGIGDLDCDGHLDIAASNGGDYVMSAAGFPYPLGKMSTNWFLGKGDDKFTNPGVGDLIAMVFGWGSGLFDYDNDGDQDYIVQGGLDINYLVWADNPGVILQNQGCSADFVWDKQALSTDYTRLNARALALGDLNRDGFVDFVTSSNFVIPKDQELKKTPAQYGSVYDDTAYYLPLLEPQATTPWGTPDKLVWNGNTLNDGVPTFEINSANNNNRSITVSLVGSVNLTDKGRVNRDGMGSVIRFTPKLKGHKKAMTTMYTVPSGSSFASQHSMETVIGLEKSKKGTLEIFWPGGVSNRLYEVKADEHITFPEIPCSYNDKWRSFSKYKRCVEKSLSDLEAKNVIDSKSKKRFTRSAIKAYNEVNGKLTTHITGM